MSFFSVFRRSAPDPVQEQLSAADSHMSAPSVMKASSLPELPVISHKDLSPDALKSRLEELIAIESVSGQEDQETAAMGYFRTAFESLVAEFPESKHRFTIDCWTQHVSELVSAIASLDHPSTATPPPPPSATTASTTSSSSSSSSL
ncbi:MAG: hypothetical protein Q8P67_07490, partial [archaeon]|nr:hypothetical protein [archaeon]